MGPAGMQNLQMPCSLAGHKLLQSAHVPCWVAGHLNTCNEHSQQTDGTSWGPHHETSAHQKATDAILGAAVHMVESSDLTGLMQALKEVCWPELDQESTRKLQQRSSRVQNGEPCGRRGYRVN